MKRGISIRRALGIATLFLVCACGDLGAEHPSVTLGADAAPLPSGDANTYRNTDAPDSPSLPSEAGAGLVDGDGSLQADGFARDGIPARTSGGRDPISGGMGPPGGMSDPTCYDGIDTNGDGNVDCADPRCQAELSCCVDSGDCCAPDRRAPVPPVLDFSTCRRLTGCYPESLIPFGDARPIVTEGYFAPGGDLDSDSGVLVGSPLDLMSGRVELTVDFLFPRICGASCLESAAVGLTTQSDLGGAPLVLPEIALLASGSRQQVSLIVNNETIASWDADRASPGWTVVVRPTGEVEVLHAGTSLLRGVPFTPHRALQLVLYGRSRNPSGSGGDNTRIQRVTTSVATCDMARAWTLPPRLLQTSGWTSSAFAGAPSFARGSGRPDLLAIAELEGIHLLERHEGAWIPTDPSGRATLSGSVPHDRAGVGDPDLVWGRETLHLYYSALSETGQRSIGLAQAAWPDGPFTVSPTPVLSDATGPEFLSYEAPSVVLHSSGTWVMVALGTRADGTRSLPIFVSPDGVVWSRLTTATLGTTVEEAFDAAPGSHSFADPDLMVHANVWYLHLSHRRGARWRIDALVSDQLLYWRALGQVLRGGTHSAERLGVSSPDARLNGRRMELYYVGHDGARQHILFSDRSSTSGGTFP